MPKASVRHLKKKKITGIRTGYKTQSTHICGLPIRQFARILVKQGQHYMHQKIG